MFMKTRLNSCIVAAVSALALFVLARSACAQSPLTNAVSALGTTAYIIGGQQNPTLKLQRGVTYVFQVNALTHPFFIKTNSTLLNADQWTEGVTGQGVEIGNLTFSVPADAPVQLVYQCGNHAPMGGILNIVDTPPTVRIVYISVSDNMVTLKSTGATSWSAFPEYRSNLTTSAWATVPSYSNSFVGGTNTTTFGRLEAICGPNVFLRVRNQQN
jgi:hypothetical protein